MSKHVRHWKQRWDPKAPLIFIRRMRLGVAGHDVVYPGDDVTPEIVAALGRHGILRLKRWWEAGYLAIKGWKSPDELRRERQAGPRAEHVGSGWFNVTMLDGTVQKVRGQAAADELLATCGR
jgi:hypothetical protein